MPGLVAQPGPGGADRGHHDHHEGHRAGDREQDAGGEADQVDQGADQSAVGAGAVAGGDQHDVGDQQVERGEPDQPVPAGQLVLAPGLLDDRDPGHQQHLDQHQHRGQQPGQPAERGEAVAEGDERGEPAPGDPQADDEEDEQPGCPAGHVAPPGWGCGRAGAGGRAGLPCPGAGTRRGRDRPGCSWDESAGRPCASPVRRGCLRCEAHARVLEVGGVEDGGPVDVLLDQTGPVRHHPAAGRAVPARAGRPHAAARGAPASRRRSPPPPPVVRRGARRRPPGVRPGRRSGPGPPSSRGSSCPRGWCWGRRPGRGSGSRARSCRGGRARRRPTPRARRCRPSRGRRAGRGTRWPRSRCPR